MKCAEPEEIKQKNWRRCEAHSNKRNYHQPRPAAILLRQANGVNSTEVGECRYERPGENVSALRSIIDHKKGLDKIIGLFENPHSPGRRLTGTVYITRSGGW